MSGRLASFADLLKMICILAAVAILVSACTNENSAVAPDIRSIQSKPISIMVPLHQTSAPKPELLQALEQAGQAKLDIEWVPNDIYKDKLVNALETNSLKQVTFVNNSDYFYVKNAIHSGMFWEIGPYLQFYPNLKSLNKAILNETAVENKIYGLYTQRPPSRQGVMIRKDWLDALHLKEPATIEELYNVMKQFTYNDPDRNGKQDTIGLAERNDLIYGAFKTLSSYFGTPNNWRLSRDGLVPEFKSQEYIDTMNFMRKLYQEKIVNTDLAVASKSLQRYMMISGKAGVYIGSLADAANMSDEMQKLNLQAELTVVNRISGKNGYRIWSMPSFSGLFLFSKKAIKTDGELRAILAYYDRSLNPVVSNLLQYGLPDKHYTIEDGKAVVTPAMNKLRDNEALPLHSLMIANLDNPNIMKNSEDSAAPILIKANHLIEDNERFLIRDPAQNLSSPAYDAKGAELSQIITNATYNYILGQIDLAAFENEISAWEKKGGDKVIQEYNEAYRKSLPDSLGVTGF